jgi:hypothetical protein
MFLHTQSNVRITTRRTLFSVIGRRAGFIYNRDIGNACKTTLDTLTLPQLYEFYPLVNEYRNWLMFDIREKHDMSTNTHSMYYKESIPTICKPEKLMIADEFLNISPIVCLNEFECTAKFFILKNV